MRKAWTLLMALVVATTALGGCIGSDDAGDDAGDNDLSPTGDDTARDPRLPPPREDAPPAPAGEEVVGLLPIDMIFDGSLRNTLTRVLLVPPAHGDLTNPTNESRSNLAYLEATLEGMFAWEPAIDLFIETYPEFSYLDEITVQVELFQGETPATLGYDFVIGYAETSGPAFRGVAIQGPGNDDQEIQRQLNEAGLGDMVHFGHRYVLLSLFASAPRGGQDLPDYPESHEMRGVTMHEFAHVWGLGHSNTWTDVWGPDLMNSPYPFVYGDGDPAGDGGERSPTLCITSLDLYGLAHLYRWLPNGTWEESTGNVSLPLDMDYTRYCEVHDEAQERARAFLAERGVTTQDQLAAAAAAAETLIPFG